MNENRNIKCAPSDRNQSWTSIDWNKAEETVKKLQARIVKAQKEGKYGKVKALQWTLTHSFYAKALAVKRVTSNSGSKTSGWTKHYGQHLKENTEPLLHLREEATNLNR